MNFMSPDSKNRGFLLVKCHFMNFIKGFLLKIRRRVA